ncbi:MAG TPA: GntR family transcriptional regulator [Firmicutes bacterium]|nr:GntR family transcriptional regulator [Bacillota bacterium]
MIRLDYRDASPIYEQIKNGLKRLMVSGAMKKGDKLPSVRALATELAINPNTIQKAYTELENEGYIYSVPGRGSFASGEVKADEHRREELKQRIRALAAELRFMGVGKEELASLLEEEGGFDHD